MSFMGGGPEWERPAWRTFDTGATRDADGSKPDYEAFLSPLVIARFGAYMQAHRQTPLGLRDGDNWQRGIPRDVYMKSAWRHFLALWMAHRGHAPDDTIEDALCAVLFNIQGYLHERLKAQAAATRVRDAIAARKG